MVDSTTTTNPPQTTITIPSPPPPAPQVVVDSKPPKCSITASSFPFPRPAIRVTSEFDSDGLSFFNKLSCKVFDNLAKFKLSFSNSKNGEISDPQIGFVSKYLSVLYDVEEQNALVKSSFSVGDKLSFAASHDVKKYQVGEPTSFCIRCSTTPFCMSCTLDDNKSVISCMNFGSTFLFRYHHRKAQQGEVTMVASLPDPSYKLELSSAVPSVGLPRATFRFPGGEVSLEEREEEEELKKMLSVSGIVKGKFLNGICTAQYQDDDVNLRYSYKDEQVSFIPRISLPSNTVAFAFKRRFSPSDKLSYLYNFDSSEWSAVYKHTVGKDLKLKAGYDSAVRLGWASVWVGAEEGTAKTVPMKMKMQFMLQVPQDDIKSTALIFRVKKRWDI